MCLSCTHITITIVIALEHAKKEKKRRRKKNTRFFDKPA